MRMEMPRKSTNEVSRRTAMKTAAGVAVGSVLPGNAIAEVPARNWLAELGIKPVINAGGTGSSCGQELLLALDHRLSTLGVSPGGSADLLAGTIFLDALERHQTWIPVSVSLMKTG